MVVAIERKRMRESNETSDIFLSDGNIGDHFLFLLFTGETKTKNKLKKISSHKNIKRYDQRRKSSNAS